MITKKLHIGMAVRCGKFTTMLMWMAEEGRLKKHELKMLRSELEQDVFNDDKKRLNELPVEFGFTEADLMSL